VALPQSSAVVHAHFKQPAPAAIAESTPKERQPRPSFLPPDDPTRSLAIEETVGNDLLPVLHKEYGSPEERRSAIISSMQSSGAAPAELAQQGADFASALKRSGVAGDWNCHRVGCYFSLNGAAPYEQMRQAVMDAHFKAASEHNMVLTHEQIPNKLVIIFSTERAVSR
jgi:hypothetical protein